jgi:hypothetical protein
VFHHVVHFFLRPLMRVLLLRIDQSVEQLPRPLDTPHAHASGTDPDRILLYGSGPAVGYGVLSHDLALPGQLARLVSSATGRGVDVDVVSDSDVVVETALPPLTSMELWRYDSIVLSLGANNSLLLTPVKKWQSAYTEILEYLNENVATGTGIYLVAVPPISSIDVFAGFAGWMAERHANRLNAETRRLAGRYSNVTFVPFSPLVKADFTRYRSAATYQQWASVIAAPLIRDLGRADRGDDSSAHLNELSRQQALDVIGILDSAAEERFTRIAVLASQLFGTDQTLIAFIDRDRLWIKAASVVDAERTTEMPRAGSFADWAIREPAPFVVTDASRDPRFAQHEAVTGGPNLRFYAAYPIESPFGERIGVISVIANQPRTWSDSETKLLRDLALMVQRELEIS